MFQNKAITSIVKEKLKKENASMNMVLVMTTTSKTPYETVFKEKEPIKNKTLINQIEKEKLHKKFETVIQDFEHQNPPIQLPQQ